MNIRMFAKQNQDAISFFSGLLVMIWTGFGLGLSIFPIKDFYWWTIPGLLTCAIFALILGLTTHKLTTSFIGKL